MRLSIRPFIIFGFTTLSWVLASHAQADVLSVDIEPIVGYEKVQQVLPTPHSTNRIMYGGRVTVGILLIAAEAEYTRGSRQQVFTDESLNHTIEHAKLGLRSGFRLGSFLRLIGRGGVQATRGQLDHTVGGVTTTSYEALRYNPYAGASAKVRLSSKLTASADVVAVIPNIQNLSENEYQVTAGFAVRFP
jgi:hypothetical protein